MKHRIGIIGYGNMGSAIAERIKEKYLVWVFDKDRDKTQILSGIKVAKDNIELVNKADTIILAVKPQDFDSVLSEIRNYAKGKLIISIAAGITTGYIERFLDAARVIRAMPNIGVRIGRSVTCLCKGRFATDNDLNFAKELFDYSGETQGLTEDKMNAATAISGSGPGYYFDAVESRFEEYKNNKKKFQDDFVFSLTQAAESVGFDNQTARFLVHWTAVYSDLLLDETKLSPGELRSQVTSKGGTTQAALEVLHKGGSLVDAVKAAAKRAEELSKKG